MCPLPRILKVLFTAAQIRPSNGRDDERKRADEFPAQQVVWHKTFARALISSKLQC